MADKIRQKRIGGNMDKWYEEAARLGPSLHNGKTCRGNNLAIAQALRSAHAAGVKAGKIEATEKHANACREASVKFLDGAQRKGWLMAMANLYDHEAAAIREAR